MYQNAALLAVFLLIYGAIAGRVERSLFSGPIVFTGVGFILGPDGLGVLRIEISGEGLRLLAEMTLAMALFTEAANADFCRGQAQPRAAGAAAADRFADDDRARLLVGSDCVPLARYFGNGITGGAACPDGCGARQTRGNEPGSAGGRT